MADCMVGQAYTPGFVLYDANGNKTTSSDSVTGTLAVTAPGVDAPGATGPLGFGGEGFWGLLVLGAAHPTPGTYQFVVANLVVNGEALGTQYGSYVVGVAQAGVRPLMDILIDLALALTDGVQSVTTAAGSTTTLTDTRWALGQANELAGAEVYFLDRTSPVHADVNPAQVTGSTNAGVITFSPANAATVPAGTPYLLGGRRYPHQQKMAAIRQVLEELGPMQATSDRATLVSVLNQYEYAVPAAFYTVRKVFRQPQSSTAPTLWWELGRGIRWDYLPERRTVVFTSAAEITNCRIRLEGLVEASLPTSLTSLVPVRAATVVRLAELYLKARGGDDSDKRESAFLFQELLRKGRIVARAGRPV